MSNRVPNYISLEHSGFRRVRVKDVTIKPDHTTDGVYTGDIYDIDSSLNAQPLFRKKPIVHLLGIDIRANQALQEKLLEKYKEFVVTNIEIVNNSDDSDETPNQEIRFASDGGYLVNGVFQQIYEKGFDEGCSFGVQQERKKHKAQIKEAGLANQKRVFDYYETLRDEITEIRHKKPNATFYRIAKELTSRKIPTTEGKEKWHGQGAKRLVQYLDTGTSLNLEERNKTHLKKYGSPRRV